MNNCFIILAAGQSKRFKSTNLKQYIYYKNKPVYEHTLDKIIKSKISNTELTSFFNVLDYISEILESEKKISYKL